MKRNREDYEDNANVVVDDDDYTTSSWLVPCAQQQGSSMTKDLISPLPEHLLLSILSRLTLRNVFRASLISYPFRNACCSLPKLRFDALNMLTIGGCDLLSMSKETKHCCGNFRHKFVNAVNQFLRFHLGTKLMAFEVIFCLGINEKEDIDRWIRFALDKDVHALYLSLICPKSTAKAKLDFSEFEENKYVLSGDVFGGSSKLRWLGLCACKFERGFLVQFNYLTSLFLEQMLLAQLDLQSMFCCMPKLKRLFMLVCVLPAKLSFGCLPNLELLCIRYCLGIKKIELSNIALDEFICSVRRAIKCNLSGAPNLLTLGYTVHEDAMQYMFSHLPENYPLLRSLYIYTRADWGNCIPEDLKTFSNLRYLTMYFSKRTRFDLWKLISVLQASPLLCELELMTRCREDVEQEKLEFGSFVHQYLEEVQIGGHFGTPSQIEFVMYLLRYAPALKKLALFNCKFSAPYFVRHWPWPEAEREGFFVRVKEIFNGEFGKDTWNRNVEIKFKFFKTILCRRVLKKAATEYP